MSDFLQQIAIAAPDLSMIKQNSSSIVGGVVVVALVVTLIVEAARSSTARIALIPFALILGAGLATWITTLGGKLTAEDAKQLVLYVLIIVAIVTIVSMAARALCYQIRPEERFTDISDPTATTDPVQALWTAVGETEKAICKLVGQTDNYIQSGIGPKGKDDPSLVTTAQQDARADAGGPLTDCNASWPTTVTDVSSQTLDETMSQLDDRITRMETTLKGFSAPVLTKAYQSTVACSTESFIGYAPFESERVEPFVATSIVALQDRLKEIKASIDYQEKKLIGGMEQKKKDLQAGKASDCDKQRGAKTAMAAGSKG
jgi:hypothetical protein